MADNKNGRKKLKRYKKVREEIHPKDLDLFTTISTIVFIVWIIMMVSFSFIPDSEFPKGRLVATYSVTLICSVIPGLLSLVHFLSREVYWEEVK